jgi:hypothetical protein
MVNGAKVISMRHLVELMEAKSSTLDYIKLSFEGSHVVVVGRNCAKESARILRNNSIPHDRSEDLRQK